MNIYNENGYLNAPEIANTGAWLIVIISARQRFGKTYNVLKYMLDQNLKHILLRRSTSEFNSITASELLNPYKAFEPGYHVGLFPRAGMATIADYTKDGNGKILQGEERGVLMSLPQVAHVRGFNGGLFSDIVFDEFIPEKGVYRRTTEGEALLNAYVTINGNREHQNRPPTRLWLLANANDINSPILDALNLTDDVIQLQKSPKEYILKNGVLIIIPKGNSAADSRSETALNRQIRKDSEFYQMAVENMFSYDQNPLIANYSIKHMTPLFSYDNLMYAWENEKMIYICRAKHNADPYQRGSWGAGQLAANYLWIKRYYYEGLIMFSDLRLLALFRNIFNIDI